MKHKDDPVSLLGNELRVLGIQLEDPVLEECVRYWDLLAEASERINLISRKDLEGGLLRHVGDSLAVLARWVPRGASTLLDVGSGGGLPGIPLAIAVPEMDVVLLEPRERKADWLVKFILELGLSDRVEVVMSRFEELGGDFTGGFDFLTARALAPPAGAIAGVLPAIGGSSRLLLWHSPRQLDSVIEAVEGLRGQRTFALEYTLSYQFRSICFSSSVSGIHEVH